MQASRSESASHLHWEGWVRLCQNFLLPTLSRGSEDCQRIGRACGRKKLFWWIIFSFITSKISDNIFQVSIGHWRRLGKLFVHGQLRQTFLPEAEQDFQVPKLIHCNFNFCFYFSILLVLRCKMTFAQIALRTARRCRLSGSVQTAGSWCAGFLSRMFNCQFSTLVG